MKRWVFIYIPMLAGSFIGWFASHFFGWGGMVGMLSGAGVWLAYELRQHRRQMEIEERVMERQLEALRGQLENEERVIGRQVETFREWWSRNIH